MTDAGKLRAVRIVYKCFILWQVAVICLHPQSPIKDPLLVYAGYFPTFFLLASVVFELLRLIPSVTKVLATTALSGYSLWLLMVAFGVGGISTWLYVGYALANSCMLWAEVKHD